MYMVQHHVQTHSLVYIPVHYVQPDRRTGGWMDGWMGDGGMEGWRDGGMEGVGRWVVASQCDLSYHIFTLHYGVRRYCVLTVVGKPDESFDVVPIPPPCLSNPPRDPPAHACALSLHRTCACTCTCTCTWVCPPVSPVYPKEPNDRPPSQRELLHCLPVHSRLQHCIFPDPHLSLPSASSSGNGNASARGRRNAFLLAISALLSLPLSLPFTCRTGTSRLACIPHSVCTLQSALCHVMPCRASLHPSTQHSTRIRAHTYLHT